MKAVFKLKMDNKTTRVFDIFHLDRLCDGAYDITLKLDPDEFRELMSKKDNLDGYISYGGSKLFKPEYSEQHFKVRWVLKSFSSDIAYSDPYFYEVRLYMSAGQEIKPVPKPVPFNYNGYKIGQIVYNVDFDVLCKIYDIVGLESDIAIPHFKLKRLKDNTDIYCLVEGLRKPIVADLIQSELEFYFECNTPEDWRVISKELDYFGVNWRGGIPASEYQAFDYSCQNYYLRRDPANLIDCLYLDQCGKNTAILNNKYERAIKFDWNDIELKSVLAQRLFDKAQTIFTTIDEWKAGKQKIDVEYTPWWAEVVGTLKFGADAWDKVMKELKEDERKNKMIKIKDVFVNKAKQTIVVKWENGETTKVTCSPADKWDVEKGVAIAIAKFYLGNNYNAGELFKRYLKKAERSETLVKTKKATKKDETKTK